MVIAQEFFEEQVSTNIFLLDTFYILASIFLFLVVIAFGFIDHGLVRRKNVLDTWVQKLLAALFGGLAFTFIGFGIWNWQYFEAFGIENSFGEAIKAWWLGGTSVTSFAQELDPAVSFEADVFQVFLVFFIAYAAAIGALIHSAGIERVKPLPNYIMAIVAGGLVMPLLAYYTWGSASPLTKNGTHDYVGNFSFYLLVGTWALIIAWRAGPRLGAEQPLGLRQAEDQGLLEPERRLHAPPAPHNLGISAAGVGLLLFAVPFLVLGCGFIVPDVGYFGIALTTSGIGIVLINIFVAFGGGALTGALIAYRMKRPLFALMGPVAGYISGTACFDVVRPWEMLLISLFAPLFVLVVYKLLERIGIDERKVVPLTLGAGLYGAIIAGFAAWHDPTGGYFGITEGSFAFQNAEISPQWQLAGVGLTIGIAAGSGLILIIGLEKTIGLRVSEAQEVAGLDDTYWGLPPVEEPPLPAPAPVPGPAGTVAPPPITPSGS
jgi:ammonium transporter, Amt family